jgi:tetratricopeptide (TPR) repeat protein
MSVTPPVATPRASGANGPCLDDAAVAEFVDGMASEPERDRVARHMDRCAACRQLVAELSRGAGAVGADAHEASDLGGATSPAETPPGDGGGSSGRAELAVGARVGRYVLLSRVGAGGLGVVYAAYDPELDRRIAVKLLRFAGDAAEGPTAEGQERLLLEARALAKLSHRHVVTVHDVGIIDGRVFIAMEYVGGSTLRQWFETQPRGWRRIVELFREAGQGLSAAHDAGLVHRDFKPDNVLLRRDGHVCVTDFGLARAGWAPAEGEPGREAASPGLATLTQTNEFVGTPAYMAPEQFTGGPVDARSDQFAFSVALFEALYGVRPFAGATLAELAANVARGEPRGVMDRAAAPAWVRRAVLRGLSVDPDRRFPTMREFLGALQERTRRRAALAGALGIAAVAAALAVGTRMGRAQPAAPAVCRAGAEKMASVWGGPQKATVQRAFADSGLGYAGSAWQTVDRTLDGYSRDWVAGYTDACEATRVRGEQSEQLLDQRMMCLEQRRKDVAALVDVFAHADRGVVTRSVQAATGLSPVGPCSDAHLLGLRSPPPSSPEALVAVDELQTLLAQARAEREAGRLARSAEIAGVAVEKARSSRQPALESEALYLRALSLGWSGDLAGGVQAMTDAALSAEASRSDEIAARAWSALVFTVGYQQGNRERGEWLARLARAALDRLGGSDEIEAFYLASYSGLLGYEGKYGDAVDALRRAVSLREKILGPSHRVVAATLGDLAGYEVALGRYDDGLAHAQRALSVLEPLLGSEHPQLVSPLVSLATVLEVVERYDEALATARRAAALAEAAFGAKNPYTVMALNVLGSTLRDLHQDAEAGQVLERALALGKEVNGADHATVGDTYQFLGLLAKDEGRMADAEKYLLAAVDQRARIDVDHPDLAYLLVPLGEVRRDTMRLDQALADHRRAVSIAERVLGPEHPLLGEALLALGETLVARHETGEARDVLGRARAILEAHPAGPSKLAEVQATLARIESTGGADKLGGASARAGK